MNLREKIFKDCHGMIDFSKAISFKNIVNLNGAGKNGYFLAPTPLQAKMVSDYLDVDLSDLYYFPENTINPYVYIKDFLLIGFHYLDIEDLERYRTKEMINQTRRKLNSYLKNKEYELFFGMVDKRIRISTYIKIFNQIPDNKKYDLFVYVYTSSETGFEILVAQDDSFTKKIFDKRVLSERWNKAMTEIFPKKIGDKKEITVYKGVGNANVEIEDYSWTLDKDIAHWFAKRFNRDGGAILIGKVDKENVLDYLEMRHEEEVLIRPKHIKEIKVEEV